jgi:hypothetical protein
MNWYKIAQVSVLWHISNAKFNRFDPSMTAQGIIWFSKDKEDLINNLHGASINNRKPVYLYQCRVDAHNMAGWEEYDKYGIGQLISMGYDAIDLDDDVAVLNQDIITILNVEQIRL